MRQVSVHALSAADEVLILGCDGLWDVLSAEEAWATAQAEGRRRDGAWDLGKAAGALTKLALQRGSCDNVSAVLIGLRLQPHLPGLPPTPRVPPGTPRAPSDSPVAGGAPPSTPRAQADTPPRIEGIGAS